MRYLPLTDADRGVMLDAIGVGSVDDLFSDVPQSVHLMEPVDLPEHKGELEVEGALSAMAAATARANSAGLRTSLTLT